MFTSRAEHRLLLRQDNADIRLSHIGNNIGLLKSRSFCKVVEKQSKIQHELNRLNTVRAGTETLSQLLRRPEVTYRDLPSQNAELPEDVIQQVEIQIKYAGYIDRQEVEIDRMKSLEDKQIPATFCYDTVPSLRMEARQKLGKIRPATIGQAARISGVSPSDIGILMIWLKRGETNIVQAQTKPAC
jgi:tRNA uridine 5-carboxymethylaminomethyl modification enzyme